MTLGAAFAIAFLAALPSALQPLRGLDGGSHRSPRAWDASGTRFGRDGHGLRALRHGRRGDHGIVDRPARRRLPRPSPASGRWRSRSARLGCLLLLADLRMRTPTLRRQTCSTWYRERGAGTAWALWGFDLGLGFSTIRLSSLYWLMVLFVAAFVPPVFAPLVLAFYGLGLGVALAGAVVAQTRSASSATSPGLGLLHAAGRVRLASVAFLGLLSVTIVLTLGAPWS